jgi:mannose-6-phosphate isomerase-like protein (cupin superfamily)
MFFVLEGTLDLLEKGRSVTVHAGEFYIVQRGSEHRVIPRGHVKLMLFEPAGVSHTGKVKSEITKDRFDRLCP